MYLVDRKITVIQYKYLIKYLDLYNKSGITMLSNVKQCS